MYNVTGRVDLQWTKWEDSTWTVSLVIYNRVQELLTVSDKSVEMDNDNDDYAIETGEDMSCNITTTHTITTTTTMVHHPLL